MIIRSAPVFKTRIRPCEIALLIVYLEEARAKESSIYLSGFLDYIGQLVLADRLEENFPKILSSHELEQAEAFLADIRQNGEPRFEN